MRLLIVLDLRFLITWCSFSVNSAGTANKSPSDEKHNEWNVEFTKRYYEPSAQQQSPPPPPALPAKAAPDEKKHALAAAANDDADAVPVPAKRIKTEDVDEDASS